MLQDALYFFKSDLIFPLLPGLSLPKKGAATSEKTKNTTMTEPPPPPPRSPDCAPHEVIQDNPLQGDEDDALSHPPDEGFDDWSPADTKRFAAMSGCDDDRLKSCIIAASTSV